MNCIGLLDMKPFGIMPGVNMDSVRAPHSGI